MSKIFDPEKMKSLAYTFIILAVLLASCSPSDLPSGIAFDDRVTPDNFPICESLDSGSQINLNTLGNREILIIDSVAILSTSDNKMAWKIISLSADTVIGGFIDAGNGPNELSMIPLLSQSSVVRHGNTTLLAVPDNMKQCWHNFNLGNIISGQNEQDSIIGDPEIDQFTVYKSYTKDNTTYRLSVNPTDRNINRRISVNGDTINNSHAEWLNHFTVDNLEHIGRLMPTVALSPSGKKVVEIYNSYPQINLYSLFGDDAVTLTPDDKVVDYVEFTGQSATAPTAIYRGIKGYEKFFVINKIGDNDTTELQFYDWEGNPVLSLIIPYTVNSFDIDFINGRIIAVNYPEDIVMEYQAKDILQKIL